MENISSSETNSIQLPSDMIIRIISDLDNVEDFKNCMLVSKEVRDMIFRTPKITRRFSYKIDSDYEEAFEFVCERGNSIRSLQFYDVNENYDLAMAFLRKIPKLEVLKIHLQQKNFESLGLDQLQRDLKMLPKGCQEINTLTSLYVEKLDSQFFEKVKCPNLKNISIGHIVANPIEFYSFWDSFVENFPNIENFIVKNYHFVDSKIFSYIISSTEKFTRLKNFLICKSGLCDYLTSFWYCIINNLEASPGFWKHWINFGESTLTSTYYITNIEYEMEMLEFLRENYEGFQFRMWTETERDMSYLLFRY